MYEYSRIYLFYDSRFIFCRLAYYRKNNFISIYFYKLKIFNNNYYLIFILEII